jgi:rfaE bifunctional protein nucleotidyltransferase chain/domain
VTDKFYEPEDLSIIVDKLRSQGKKIGLSHGVFDLLHPGHIQHFIAAKKEVDFLIVSITSDAFVNKGPGRPIFAENIRISTLSALSAVDYVTISRGKTAEKIIESIRPNIYFKGSDYANASDDPTGKISDEKQIVEKFGGKLHFTDEITSSSSKLINSFLNSAPVEVKNWVQTLKSKYSIVEVENYLQRIENLKVVVIGETIIDQYTKVEALSKSSKDPILAFHLLDTEVYAGGILAIANNCASWTKEVTAISVIANDDLRPNDIAKLLSQNIQLKLITSNRPTITKHRYVDIGTNTKLFETYDFNPNPLPDKEVWQIIDAVSSLENYDVLLAADYGHGLFTNQLIEHLTEVSPYFCVNTQSNAGNRGYNTITKYSKVDFFSVNSGELRLEMRSQKLNYDLVVPELMSKLSAHQAVLTKGAEGLTVYEHLASSNAPAIATKIVDKVGAGDSVFAISSLLSYVKAPLDIIGLVSSVVASHEVSQFGHRTSMSIGDIKKQVRSLMS